MRLPHRAPASLPLPSLLLVLCLLFPALTAVRAAPAAADDGPWRWPLADEPRVIRGFDPPPERWLPGHRGVDLAADTGAEVRAAGDGRVAFAGQVAGTGVVSILHGELRTTYLPVDAGVVRGDRVFAGGPIGVLADGSGHCGAYDCLHWGLRRERTYLDPLSLLGEGKVRLLPVHTAAGMGPGASSVDLWPEPTTEVTMKQQWMHGTRHKSHPDPTGT